MEDDEEHLLPTSLLSVISSSLLYDVSKLTFENDILGQIKGNVLQIATTKIGSIYLQDVLNNTEYRNAEIIHQCVLEACSNIMVLMKDMFGNYFVQTVFTVATHEDRKKILESFYGIVHILSLSKSSSYALQNIIYQIKNDDEYDIIISIFEYGGCELNCRVMKNKYGNHVYQRLMSLRRNHEIIADNDNNFIVSTFLTYFVDICTNKYGLTTIRDYLKKYSSFYDREKIGRQVVRHLPALVNDPSGNYIVQYIIMGNAGKELSCEIFDLIRGNLFMFCKQKYSSNIVERCFEIFPSGPRHTALFHEIFNADPSIFDSLFHDNFGNYVIQAALRHCSDNQEKRIMKKLIYPLLPTLEPHKAPKWNNLLKEVNLIS